MGRDEEATEMRAKFLKHQKKFVDFAFGGSSGRTPKKSFHLFICQKNGVITRNFNSKTRLVEMVETLFF